MQIDVAINSFIVVLLFIAWGWNFPEDYLSRKMLRPLKGIILYSGLWHGWNMFAPEPLFVNRRLLAQVHLANGKTIEWESEDAGRMGWWPAFLFVRERKLIDNLLSGQFGYLKPAMSDYLARKFRAQGHDVVKVELVQMRQPISPPAKWREQTGFERKVLWTYVVPKQPNAVKEARLDRKEVVEEETRTAENGDTSVEKQDVSDVPLDT